MTVNDLIRHLAEAQRQGWGDAPVVYGGDGERSRVDIEGGICASHTVKGDRGLALVLAPLSLRDVGGF